MVFVFFSRRICCIQILSQMPFWSWPILDLRRRQIRPSHCRRRAIHHTMSVS